MSVTLVNNGTWSSTSTSTLSVGIPASLVSGNMLVLNQAHKDATSTAVSLVTTPPSGWTAGSSGESGTIVSSVSDEGSVRTTNYWKVSDGADAAPNVVFTDADPQAGIIWQFARSGGTGWLVADTVLVDTTETGTGVSATGSTLDVTTGDFLAIQVWIKGDTITHSSQSFAITGCTLETPTWTKSQTTTGGDIGAYRTVIQCTAGNESAAPVYTATSSLSGAAATAVGVVRVRQNGADPVADLPPSLFVTDQAVQRASIW